MTYEILTKTALFDISDDSEAAAFYAMQNALFAELTERETCADVCYTFLINESDVFCGTMSEMWAAYAERDGADFVRFSNSRLGYVAYDCGRPVTRIQILSESDRTIYKFEY